jgi:multidrug resistance efflux pump
MRRVVRSSAGYAFLAGVLVCTFLAISGCQMPGSSPAPGVIGDESPMEASAQRDIVSMSGEVLPARRSTLAMTLAGRVATVHVATGDMVEAGQLLIQLDDASLRIAVDSARAALVAAEADLDGLAAGPRSQQVLAAEAAVARSEAALLQARAAQAGAEAGVTAARSAHLQAQSTLKGMEAALQMAEEAQNSARAQIPIVQATLNMAQAELARVQAGPARETIAAARAQMEKADANRAQAQSEYDKIAWAGGVSSSPQAIALQQATADYDAARATYEGLLAQPRAVDVAVAQAGVEQARAQLAAAEQAVEAAAPAIDQAQAQVDSATDAIVAAEAARTQAEASHDSAVAGVQAAQAARDAAQADLDLLKAGAAAAQLDAARARVDAAAVAVTQAEATLEQAALRAPFAGVIGDVLIREGEFASPGAPVIDLGDVSLLRVETTDFNEIDLYKIEIGQIVQVTFDAAPNTILIGRVVEIAPKSTRGQAGTNYRMIVEFEEDEPLLRWGMTAFIDALIE